MLSNYTDEETLRLTLRANIPAAEAVGATAEAGVDGAWIREGNAGVFRCGSKPGAQYTTLYHTVSVSKKKWSRREPYIEGEDDPNKDQYVECPLRVP